MKYLVLLLLTGCTVGWRHAYIYNHRDYRFHLQDQVRFYDPAYGYCNGVVITSTCDINGYCYYQVDSLCQYRLGALLVHRVLMVREDALGLR